MSTSAYHAGAPTLNGAMRDTLRKKPKATLEDRLSTIIATDLMAGRFRGASKDYPPQLYAAHNLLLALSPSDVKPTREVELITLDLRERTPIAELVRRLGFDSGQFFEDNPQYASPESIVGGNEDIVRFTVPLGTADQLRNNLEIDLRAMFDPGTDVMLRTYLERGLVMTDGMQVKYFPATRTSSLEFDRNSGDPNLSCPADKKKGKRR